MTENQEHPILFFCKDCQKVVVDPKKRSNKYAYNCPVCKSPKISFGSKQSICDFFHIKEVQLEKMLANLNQK